MIYPLSIMKLANNIDKDSLVVFQWNIGHFSHGGLPFSNISQDDIQEAIINYNNILEQYAPDIISINEYSNILGEYQDIKFISRDILFHSYKFAYLFPQNNYSCNSVFSRYPLMDVRNNSFSCNKDTQITHTSAIKADDYYYISSFIIWNGKLISFISTHLAFDDNNEEIAKAQIRELVDKFSECDYVIMCGDWNCSQDSFDIFKDNDYQLANCDQYGNIITYPALSKCLDNIIVKGLSVHNIKVIKTDLSDHYPIMCTIKFK